MNHSRFGSRGPGFERGTWRRSRRIGPETGLVYKAEGGGTEDRDRWLHWCLEEPVFERGPWGVATASLV